MKIRLLEALLKADLVYLDGREVIVCPDSSDAPEQVICVAGDGTESQWVFDAQDVEVVGTGPEVKVHAVSTDGEEVQLEFFKITPLDLAKYSV